MWEVLCVEREREGKERREEGEVMESKQCLVGLIPFAAMVIVECLDVGLTTLSKAAMSKGMNHFVFVVYSNALASLLLFPFSFLFNRRRPSLSFSLLVKFFLLSLVGITIMQNCVFTGVGYSSPTLGSAMSNLIPAFTFLLSLICRMEKVNLRSRRSLVKILGTVVSILGALVVTLYKGPSVGAFLLLRTSSSQVVLSSSGSQLINHFGSTKGDWVIGGFFFAIASFSVSVWNVSQAVILKGFPSEITIVFFYCLFGSIQSALVAMVAVTDRSAWNLKPDVELITIIYSAVFGSMVTFSVHTWCIHKKGPVFVAMFKPLGIAIAALFGVIFLGDSLHIGTILGATTIVLGFYAVMWSQSQEEQSKHGKDKMLLSDSEKDPLLQGQYVTNRC